MKSRKKIDEALGQEIIYFNPSWPLPRWKKFITDISRQYGDKIILSARTGFHCTHLTLESSVPSRPPKKPLPASAKPPSNNSTPRKDIYLRDN